VIRVYDLSGDRQVRRTVVLRAAEAIVTDAGVDAEWIDCGPPRQTLDSRCRSPRAADQLIVRIVREGEVTAADTDARFALGYAVVEATGVGALATVFTDRVQRLAHQSGTDRSVLLGRVIAHEVGHLLLRSQGHGVSGLMRERWTDTELVRDRQDDWQFSAADRARLRQPVQVTRQTSTSSTADSPKGDTR
jgi:hypothetical protein